MKKEQEVWLLSSGYTYNLQDTKQISFLGELWKKRFSAFQLPSKQYYQLSWWVNYDFSKAGIWFYGIFENIFGQKSYVHYIGENLSTERDAMIAQYSGTFDGKVRYPVQFSLDPSGRFAYERLPCAWLEFQKTCFFAGKQKGRFILFANPDSQELLVDIIWS